MKKLKSELKNEEMALVLLKKLKQSQQLPREVTSLGGGATLTATKPPQKNDPKNLQRQNSTNDMLNSEKLVSYPLIITDVTFLLLIVFKFDFLVFFRRCWRRPILTR